MRKRVVGNDGTLERKQQIVLTKSGNFQSGDVERVLTILSDAATETLKVKSTRSLRNPFGGVKVTGNGIVQGNMLMMHVEIPLDTRYEQTPAMVKAFNGNWSNQVHSKLGVTSGGFVPKEIREGTMMVKQDTKSVTPKPALVSKPVVGLGVPKEMTLTLTRVGKFSDKDIARATEVVKDSAIKNLKLRAGANGYNVVGKGEVNGNKMVLSVRLPLDSRYAQPSPEEFQKAYKSGLKRKLTLTKIS